MDNEWGEVEEIYNEVYCIECPKCGYDVEHKSVCNMPWGEDNEEYFTCPECGKRFTVRPKYKFLGFFNYTDSWEDTDEEIDIMSERMKGYI